MSPASERPVLRVADADAWRAWLEANHTSSPGVQLALAKGIAEGIRYAEALDEALCFGWIDGRKQGLSDTEWLQTFTPRTAKSIWSQRNREHIDRLERSGRLTDRGRLEVDRAKADGRWDAAYAGSRTIEVPDDLAAALASSPEASAMFATLTSQNRFAILFRIGNVKRAETRARKITEYVAMLERGETIYPQLRRE
ncbi:YdeI family protein [Humibacter sp. RRB41]|uniref:YdeI/OmpD-associated family protein n=1 Tax=Humibacter sp. RRB41 TaxID=2919946 RepID=UPI001FAB25D9|nr:YdeI/OmpD-associated family protein [Humibacter sp. RRB41]